MKPELIEGHNYWLTINGHKEMFGVAMNPETKSLEFVRAYGTTLAYLSPDDVDDWEEAT